MSYLVFLIGVLVVGLLGLKLRHVLSSDLTTEPAALPPDLASDISGESVQIDGNVYVQIRVKDVRGRVVKYKIDPRHCVHVSHDLLRWGARSLPTSVE
jgi:hypothetical protein